MAETAHVVHPTYLTFRGDVRDTVMGQVMGPDIQNGFSVAVDAEYLVLANITRVRFEPITDPENVEVLPNEFGELRRVTNE